MLRHRRRIISQDIGETALHLAILREMGNSLQIVDFLIQNMPTGGIDRTTVDGETALHLSARHDRSEAMKLLLRAGADPSYRNKQDKTPLDIAQEMGHHTCKELVRVFTLIITSFLFFFTERHVFRRRAELYLFPFFLSLSSSLLLLLSWRVRRSDFFLSFFFFSSCFSLVMPCKDRRRCSITLTSIGIYLTTKARRTFQTTKRSSRTEWVNLLDVDIFYYLTLSLRATPTIYIIGTTSYHDDLATTLSCIQMVVDL